MKKKFRAFKNFANFVKNHQFATFVFSAIFVAGFLTFISLTIYAKSGDIKLDLSRPGFENVREEIKNNSNEQPFSSSGNLDKTAREDFLRRLENQQKELQNTGDFSADDALSDKNLGLE